MSGGPGLIRVPVVGAPMKSVQLNPKATQGATLPGDLTDAKGVPWTLASLAAALQATGLIVSAGVTAHRLLAGLSLGDDHPQYLRKDTLTAKGDIYVATGAAWPATNPTRLGAGVVGQVLTVVAPQTLGWGGPLSPVPGPPGEDGADGERGPPGAAGVSGSAGAVGGVGPPGSAGEDGNDGDRGPPGQAGTAGAAGPQGASGPPGLPGEDGIDGNDGPPGLSGLTGGAGPQGASGPPGFTGEDGEDGYVGPPGTAGLQGVIGPQGIQGVFGPRGAPGDDGDDGDRGAPGIVGSAGAQGPVGPATPGGYTYDAAQDIEDPAVHPGPFNRAETQTITAPWTFNRLVAIIAAAGSSGLGVVGAANSYAEVVTGSSTANQSLGTNINAGTSASDVNLLCQNATGGSVLFEVRGDGTLLAPTGPMVSSTGTSGSLANATATTIATLPSIAIGGVFLVQAILTSSGSDPADYGCSAVVITSGAVALLTLLRKGTLSNLSMSGLAVQYTQSSGGVQPAGCFWSILRIM